MHTSRGEYARRIDYIVSQLLENGYVNVNDMAARLYVSPATIRRDLQLLENQGFIRRTHGGAVHATPYSDELTRFYRERETKCLSEKHAIGRLAAGLVSDRETIALSGGSTNMHIAMHLIAFQELTVIVNDLSIVRQLAQHPGIRIFVPGGFLSMGKDSLVGQHAIDALQDFRIDKVFISVTSASLQLGATAGHISNVMYLRALVTQAQQCIVVADHTKFQQPPSIVICSWEDVNLVITDSAVAPEVVEGLNQCHVKLLIAS